MNGSPERDQSIERLLRQSLNAPQKAATDACLDAETLAAWADGGLSNAALEAVQLHVADCARCQSLVGTLARTDIVAARIEPARAATWWRLGWLVPLTAAAAAIAIWVAVPTDTADRRPTAPALEADSANKARSREPMTDSAANAATEATTTPPRETQQRDDARLRESAPRSSSVELERAPAAAPQELRKDSTAVAITPPSATASISRQGGATGRIAEPLAATAPSVRTVAENVATADAAVTAGATFARIAGLEVASPDPQVRWRVVGARVERTIDGGARWEAQPTGTTTELDAGAAPSRSICWMVGRGGVVLLSTDGQSWRRLPFPEATDLSGVRATDARAAEVTTADGRTFKTTDAGATWAR